jgi:hypothetical protein
MSSISFTPSSEGRGKKEKVNPIKEKWAAKKRSSSIKVPNLSLHTNPSSMFEIRVFSNTNLEPPVKENSKVSVAGKKGKGKKPGISKTREKAGAAPGIKRKSDAGGLKGKAGKKESPLVSADTPKAPSSSPSAVTEGTPPLEPKLSTAKTETTKPTPPSAAPLESGIKAAQRRFTGTQATLDEKNQSQGFRSTPEPQPKFQPSAQKSSPSEPRGETDGSSLGPKSSAANQEKAPRGPSAPEPAKAETGEDFPKIRHICSSPEVRVDFEELPTDRRRSSERERRKSYWPSERRGSSPSGSPGADEEDEEEYEGEISGDEFEGEYDEEEEYGEYSGEEEGEEGLPILNVCLKYLSSKIWEIGNRN